MCIVVKVGNSVQIHASVNGVTADCPVVNYGGVGVVLVGMEPMFWPIRRELLQFPGLLQMVRAYDPKIVCLKLSTES